VYSPPPADSAEYLMQTYGITAEQAGDGSPDIVRIDPVNDPTGRDARRFRVTC
jgi:hypothetical protein